MIRDLILQVGDLVDSTETIMSPDHRSRLRDIFADLESIEEEL